MTISCCGLSEWSDRMRGPDDQTSGMFSYPSPEQRVRQDHPLRAIRRMTDQVLASLSPRFSKMYSDIGRPSIPPEQLLRALLIQLSVMPEFARFPVRRHTHQPSVTRSVTRFATGRR